MVEYILANKCSMLNESYNSKPEFLKRVIKKNVEESWSLWEFWKGMYNQQDLQGRDMVQNGSKLNNDTFEEQISPVKSYKSSSSSNNSPNKLAEELGYCTVKEELKVEDENQNNISDPL